MENSFILIHSLGWALLHSFWQAGLVYLALRLFFALLPSLSAAIRHNCAYVALTAVFVWFVAGFLLGYQQLQTGFVRVTEGTGTTVEREYLIAFDPSNSVVKDLPLLQQVERYLPLIIVVYAAGLGFFMLRFLWEITLVYRLRHTGLMPVPEALLQQFRLLQQQMGLKGKTRLSISELVKGPSLVGWLKPVVLLPVSALSGLPAEGLEAILLHELAHIRRQDYLLNMLQRIMEAFLFLNPFTWLLSGIINREREHCCDDLVVSMTRQPFSYVQALAVLRGKSLETEQLSIGFNKNKHLLLNRIKRIMEMKTRSTRYSHVAAAAVLMTTLVCSVLWLTPATAQNKKSTSKNTTTSSQSTRVTEKEDEILIDSTRYPVQHRVRKQMPERIKKQIETDVVPQAMAAAESALAVAGEAMKEVDVAAIVSEAMNAVDWEAIGEAVSRSIRSVNWDKIGQDVKEGISEAGREVNDPEIRRKVKAAQEEARREVESMRREAARSRLQARSDIRNSQKDREAAMQSATRELYGTRETLSKRADVMRQAEATRNSHGRSADYHSMLQAMDKDGIIDRRGEYSIIKSGKTLLINGQVQEPNVLKKYNEYLQGDNIILKGSNGAVNDVIRD